MITEKVNDYPDLRKVNKCFVVNTNREEYLRAVARRKEQRDNSNLKNRVTILEDKMDLILKLLTEKK